MATSIQKRGEGYQLRITHKLLVKPFFSTFSSLEEAQAHRDGLMDMLSRGVVPRVMLDVRAPDDNPLLLAMLSDYERKAPVTASDKALLRTMTLELRGVRLKALTPQWVDAYVLSLKVVRNIAPGSIRKRIGALARVLDWWFRAHVKPGENLPGNPFRGLPRGYSLYAPQDQARLRAGQQVKTDVERSRRLSPDEAQALAQWFDRHPLHAELQMLFELIVDTGLRLSEAYRLRVEQVDLQGWFLRVEGSKGHRGAPKPRTVPLKKTLRPMLAQLCELRGSGRLFSFWDGTAEDLPRCTRRLSHQFSALFRKAGVPDFTEHDLRHEACCRWLLLRDERGWLFSELEVMKIMGWKSRAMMLRYASLRGEDLSARLG